MGLLSEGHPLSWDETKKYADHVRKHGIQQFINQFHRLKNRTGDVLLWGDEVEYVILKADEAERKIRVSLRGQEILEILTQKEREAKPEDALQALWRPEYGGYMIEGTPGVPYGGLIAHFNVVESNMKTRRQEVKSVLMSDEFLLSVTSFPRLGCPDFTDPETKPDPRGGGASKSLFFPDEAIFAGHPRFKTLTRNIRERRGEKVAINLPIFRDVNTPDPFIEDFSALGDDGEAAEAAKPNHVYMDAMGFGMGCCCLQVTFQACNIDEARKLYDQLAVLCPIMLALSAASPIYRGHLVDRDCRWDVVSASVDCRTKEERGLEPLTHDRFIINKSRYDSIDSYISEEGECYNDLPLVYDPEIYQQLKSADVDHLLSQHIAHLFIRDPISLFQEKINQNDEEEIDHFENIQSTNWQTMRFKIPPPKSSIGWRVEFRPCEVQLTDFENAAYVVFVVLLTRVILSYELNFLIPITKVDENMRRAQTRNAVKLQKFWFRRRDLYDKRKGICNGKEAGMTPSKMCCQQEPNCGPDCSEMTLNEIINGKDDFPGLIPLMQAYLNTVEVDTDTHCTVMQYLRLIKDRASGDVKTTAAWIRDFVASHPDYKQDSVVSDEVNYDLMVLCKEVSEGRVHPASLLGPQGSVRSKTKDDIPRAIKIGAQIYENGRRVLEPSVSAAASLSDVVG